MTGLLEPHSLGRYSRYGSRLPEAAQVRIGVACYFLMGAGLLAAWNAFITAADYFNHVYPGWHMDRLFTVCYLPMCLLWLGILIRWPHMLSPRTRILAGYAGFALVMLAVPLLDATVISSADVAPTGALVPLLGFVLALGLFDGLAQGAVYGEVAHLPPPYMQAVCSGTASSGLIICLLRLATKAALMAEQSGAMDPAKKQAALRASTRLYFALSGTLSVGCLVVYAWLLPRLDVIRRHREEVARAAGAISHHGQPAHHPSSAHGAHGHSDAGALTGVGVGVTDASLAPEQRALLLSELELSASDDLGPLSQDGDAASGGAGGSGHFMSHYYLKQQQQQNQGAFASVVGATGMTRVGSAGSAGSSGSRACRRLEFTSTSGAGGASSQQLQQPDSRNSDGLQNSDISFLYDGDGAAAGAGLSPGAALAVAELEGMHHHHDIAAVADEGASLLPKSSPAAAAAAAANIAGHGDGQGGGHSCHRGGGAHVLPLPYEYGGHGGGWGRVVRVVGQVWRLAVGVAVVYVGTLSIFPGFLAEDVHSAALGDWYPLLLITAFNAADLTGKSIPPGWPRGLLPNDRVALRLACARCVVLPGAFIAAALLAAPTWAIAGLTVCLGLSNGYLTSQIMMMAPGHTAEADAGISEAVIVFSLVAGLNVGAYLGWLWLLAG